MKVNNQKELIKKLKRSMRFKILILLAILLSFNTFAWFVYTSTISTSIKGYVKSWKISFENNIDAVQYFDFNLKDLFPGMPNYENSVRIHNYSETKAEVNFKIKKIRVLNQVYSDSDYSSEQLLSFLNNNPFNVKFILTKNILNPLDDFTTFKVDVKWPYEQNNDDADTIWGHNAYEFKKNFPDKKQLEIEVMLSAKQIN